MAKILPGMDEQEETKDSNFVFVMDNYFTLPKVVREAGLQGVNIGCVGTFQARKGWTPKPIAEVNDKKFITLYHYDNNSFCIFCWVDNNVVTMVSMIHLGEEGSRGGGGGGGKGRTNTTSNFFCLFLGQHSYLHKDSQSD